MHYTRSISPSDHWLDLLTTMEPELVLLLNTFKEVFVPLGLPHNRC